MTTINFDEAVVRSWSRRGKNLPHARNFWWAMVSFDPLLTRQYQMMREGRHTLHNVIRSAHGLPRRYA